jgi:serine/threonine-protein kinase
MARTPAQSGNDQRMIGKTVAGRYGLVRLLGDGGMGAVYKAEDNVLRRFVALKLLHPAAAANPAAVERFLREAQAAASIGHPNIIDILDFGESDGKPYLVMEYLRGRSLADALATDGPFTVRHACAIATHALAGLQGAHDRGILHRDLKPANLMLTARFGDRTFVKLLDFGFAALLGDGASVPDRSLTPARTLVGTPAYAAPERLRGDDRRDPRTDLYALGVVLFEMLAGVRPFDASSFSELARKVQNDPAPALRLYRPDTPEALEKIVAKALAKNADDRFQDAEGFAAALVPFGGRMVESDDSASDSLSMDLLKIRARERKHVPTGRTKQPAPGALPKPATHGSLHDDSDDLVIDRISLDVGPRARQSAPRPSTPGAESRRTPGSEGPDVRGAAGAANQNKELPPRHEAPATLPAPPKHARALRTPLPPIGSAGGPSWLNETEKASRLPDETIRNQSPAALRTSAQPGQRKPELPTPRAEPTFPGLPRQAMKGAPQPGSLPQPSARSGAAQPGTAQSVASPAATGLAAPGPASYQGRSAAPPAAAAALSAAAKPAPSATSGSASGRTPTHEAAGRDREVESSVGLSILRFVSHRYGERSLAGVLAALPQDARSVFTAGLSPGVWISFEAVSALVEAIDRKLGRDDLHLIADCGRAVAEGTAERLHEPGQPFPPPELLLAEMPRYLISMFRGVQCRVRSIGRGYGRIELDELAHPASLTLCVVVLGVLDRTLGRFGAREVEVNLLNCRYLGDDENLFDISWLIA